MKCFLFILRHIQIPLCARQLHFAWIYDVLHRNDVVEAGDNREVQVFIYIYLYWYMRYNIVKVQKTNKVDNMKPKATG